MKATREREDGELIGTTWRQIIHARGQLLLGEVRCAETLLRTLLAAHAKEGRLEHILVGARAAEHGLDASHTCRRDAQERLVQEVGKLLWRHQAQG